MEKDKILNEADPIMLSKDQTLGKAPVDIKKMSQDNIEKEKAQKAAEEEAARRAELEKKAEEKIKNIESKLNLHDDSPDDSLQVFFDELVPPSGKADTEAGELVRAMMRIVYRDWNDGDLFYDGYGKETCLPSVQYLCDTFEPSLRMFEDIAENGLEEDEYTEALGDIEYKLMEYLLNNKYLMAEPNEVDSILYDADEDYWTDLAPKYDYDCDVSGELLEKHLDLGDIDWSDVKDCIEGIVEYDLSGDSDAWVDQWALDAFTIKDLSKEDYEILNRSFDKWFFSWVESLADEYGDPYDREEDDDEYEDDEEDIEEALFREGYSIDDAEQYLDQSWDAIDELRADLAGIEGASKDLNIKYLGSDARIALDDCDEVAKDLGEIETDMSVSIDEDLDESLDEEMVSATIDIAIDPESLDSQLRHSIKGSLSYEVISEEGPAGGWPVIKLSGTREDVIDWLKNYYDVEDPEFYLDESLKEGVKDKLNKFKDKLTDYMFDEVEEDELDISEYEEDIIKICHESKNDKEAYDKILDYLMEANDKVLNELSHDKEGRALINNAIDKIIKKAKKSK